ncbi:PREDICTED: cilia- and flagella-associated protein 58-like [Atta cephalotes]|uniref:Cilia- and flagella-associated protein 58 central coiled coil domain-containing protein n=1 Tax=Atta cephalotes TaxID=12957 RepID=A0A158NS75_ATTCE|nr:PREDICTED: cilia- and flagella-associated protein 58-like [Atta cephalotes]
MVNLRIKEHHQRVRLKYVTQSALSEHNIETGHQILFDKTTTINNIISYFSRNITVNKKRDNLLKEREILIGELETMRQRMKNMSTYAEELEQKNNEVNQRMTEMQETIGMQLNEISREKGVRERLEIEVRQLQEEIIIKKNELEVANVSIEASANNLTRLESLIKDQKITDEKLRKEISKLMLKKMNLQTDFDNANAEIKKLENEISEKGKKIRDIKYELNRTKEDSAKYKHEKDLIDKRLLKAESEQSKLKRELKQTLIDVKNVEQDAQTCHKEQFEDKQRIKNLLREKTNITVSKETAYERIKRLNYELLLCGHGKKMMEHELNTLTQTINDMKTQMEVVEKERDRYSTAVQGLGQKLERQISDTKQKQVEVLDYKKRLADTEIKYRQHQSLFEAVRAERNLCNKSLIETQEEVQDLKSKLKITSQQTEQLKEDIALKEVNLVKKEFLLRKVDKEKEELKIDLQTSHTEISNLRQQIEEAKKEEKSLRLAIHQADSDIVRQKKDIDNVMNERDILGTQLVRRNDELSLQYSRMKVLNRTLQCGEKQYNQRLEDIRLLKFEVNRLRTEKMLLAKNIFNVSDLRQEVFHLNRNLTKEMLKVTALEEEIQTPLNIHRWRKLEGTDPTTFELVKKVQILQERILKMSTDIIHKERKLNDTEKLYMNLRDVLSKQPNSQREISLDKVQNILRKREEKIKCLIAELNMYESQVGEYKNGMTIMTNEMCELMKIFHAQKRKLQKIKEMTLKSTYKTMLPDILVGTKKFYGGGFKIKTFSSKIHCTTDSSASK